MNSFFVWIHVFTSLEQRLRSRIAAYVLVSCLLQSSQLQRCWTWRMVMREKYKAKVYSLFGSQTVAYQAPPQDFPGKSTAVGCHCLLQEIFPTQGLNLGLPHCRQILHSLSHHGKTDLKPVPLSTIHMIFGKYSIHFIPPSIQSFTYFHKS